MPFTSCPLENNKFFNENMRKPEPIIKPFNIENINTKREEIKHIRLYNHERNVKKVMNDELSEERKDESNKIIAKRINVINNNNLGDEMNKEDKYMDNSWQNIISISNKEEIKNENHQKFIKFNFSKIKLKEKFNCFNYLFYIIFCKKMNVHIKFYEDLRKLLISEEATIQNYLNIYKLLEVHNGKGNT